MNIIRSMEVQIARHAINTFKYFLLMRNIVERGIVHFGNKPRLYIWIAYINFIYLDNKFIALYDLMNAIEFKPRLSVQFLIYKLE